jgi:hypothetical protein
MPDGGQHEDRQGPRHCHTADRTRQRRRGDRVATSMPYCVRVPFRRAIKSNRLVTDIVIFELREPDMISSWKVYAFSLATLLQSLTSRLRNAQGAWTYQSVARCRWSGRLPDGVCLFYSHWFCTRRDLWACVGVLGEAAGLTRSPPLSDRGSHSWRHPIAGLLPLRFQANQVTALLGAA